MLGYIPYIWIRHGLSKSQAPAPPTPWLRGHHGHGHRGVPRFLGVLSGRGQEVDVDIVIVNVFQYMYIYYIMHMCIFDLTHK